MPNIDGRRGITARRAQAVNRGRHILGAALPSALPRRFPRPLPRSSDSARSGELSRPAAAAAVGLRPTLDSSPDPARTLARIKEGARVARREAALQNSRPRRPRAHEKTRPLPGAGGMSPLCNAHCVHAIPHTGRRSPRRRLGHSRRGVGQLAGVEVCRRELVPPMVTDAGGRRAAQGAGGLLFRRVD